MSREIKFRIWDKANKEYKILGATGLDARNGDVIDYNEGNRLGGPEKYDVEQYTGDKDQYNTPICEGDIVRICETDIGEVLQDYDGRWIILGIPKEKLRDGDSVLLGNLEKLQKWCLADILSKEYCSVIGNIHENPELLGGEG